jgi:hypothetical protein
VDSTPALTLDGAASGLRHLRFARETLGSIEGHLAEAPLDAAALRAVLEASREELAVAIDTLSAAVKAYRDFLERTRTAVRGRVRAASAWGRERGELLETCDREDREPRRRLVRERVAALRATLERVHSSLSQWDRVAGALFPPLADALHVADVPDADDDATR